MSPLPTCVSVERCRSTAVRPLLKYKYAFKPEILRFRLSP
jgi:hypothetical protein